MKNFKCTNADFGILLICHQGIYFFEENPEHWVQRDKTEVEYNQMFE